MKRQKYEELSPEEQKEFRAKKRKKKKTQRIIDRIFGFFLATGIVGAIAALLLEYVLVLGPSPALKNLFIMTMMETRRFNFISNVYLPRDEVQEIFDTNKSVVDVQSDSSLISIASKDENIQQVDETGKDAYGLVDDDGDGIIYVDVKGPGFVGYMIVILDPTRVFLGMPDSYSWGGSGLALDQYIEKYGAIGGINGGGFPDTGSALGGMPEGLTIVDGVHYCTEYYDNQFAGLDANGILHCGYYDTYSAEADNIQYGVSFKPLLIVDGEPADLTHIVSGVNPRSAIGQRSDGAIVMLAIDGRQTHSLGATYQDVIDLLLSYGVVNALNLDGGSSSSLYYNGQYINKCSSASGFSRNLPNAWLFR